MLITSAGEFGRDSELFFDETEKDESGTHDTACSRKLNRQLFFIVRSLQKIKLHVAVLKGFRT